LRKPAVANGAPRSETKTNGEAGDFPLEPSQRAQFDAGKPMDRGRAVLGAADVHLRLVEIEVVPLEPASLGWPQSATMAASVTATSRGFGTTQPRQPRLCAAQINTGTCTAACAPHTGHATSRVPGTAPANRPTILQLSDWADPNFWGPPLSSSASL
jgi:hypothetical protein